jgi:dipeptidase D
MTTALENLEPNLLWKHFAALAAIPRASTKEAAAREYVLAQARRLGLDSIQDAAGNVIVRKPAYPGREQAATAVLQGHLDMVCEKNESTEHNFDTDPIRVLRDGDWLKADGTTLGADNGVGVAAALAVMDSPELAHGPLEFVFTIDEETGLTGATSFSGGVLRAKYFLNLDNEDIGTLCIGCAGGVNTLARRKVAWRPASGGAAHRIKATGLQGGHSGVDINLGRGNALRVLGAVLQRLIERLSVQIAVLKGGSAHNAIPREAWAVVLAEAGQESDLKSLVAAIEAELRLDLGGFDPGLQITVENVARPEQVLTAEDAKRTADLLVSMPHGVLAMSPDVAGLVQNSTNLATVALRDREIEIGTSQRSAIESSKWAAANRVATVCRLAGFEVEHTASYPGWKPEPDSELVQQMQAAHRELYGEPARLLAMHAGLECGVIGKQYPGMQMVSFGPQIENPHSPNERVQISSVATFWNYLRKVLETLA